LRFVPIVSGKSSFGERVFDITPDLSVVPWTALPSAGFQDIGEPVLADQHEQRGADPGKRGAELLFQVLTDREEKKSVAIASSESFGGWTKTFTGPRLCAAIVDRLTFGSNILETGTGSCRLAQARAQQAAASG
jgi:hypothetical protein